MKKMDLVDRIAEKAGLNKKQAEAALGAFSDVVTEALLEGDKVQVPGFGIFEVRDVAARTARNPATGESIDVPATKKPAFKPSKTLKDKFYKAAGQPTKVGGPVL